MWYSFAQYRNSFIKVTQFKGQLKHDVTIATDGIKGGGSRMVPSHVLEQLRI